MRHPKAMLFALLVLPATQACGGAGQAGAATDPAGIYPDRPAGPVLDEADILKAVDEASLDRHLRDYYDETGTAIVVVSVNSLKGQAIDPFATGLFNLWGIGDARTGGGLLLLVAPNERKVRIEVGCGLEAAITNAAAGDIIKQTMLPAFREGDLQGGTLAGVKALEKRLETVSDRGPTSEICLKMMRQAA